jgi:hypothetical protein
MRCLLLCLLTVAVTAALGFVPAVTPDGNTDWTVAGGSVASVDSPVGWTPDTLLTQPDDKESREPSAGLDARGRLHVAWKDNRRLQGHDEIHYLMRDSSGWRDFECVSNMDTAHNSPALVVDSRGNVHVFFLRWSGQPYSYDLGYRRRDGTTGEWGDEERLTDMDSLSTAARPQAVVVGDSVFVFWRITNASPQLFGYIYNNGGGWSDYRVVSTGEERYRTNIALRASSDGWIHVVWEDDRTDTTQLWHRYHDGDSWSAPYRTTFHGYNAVQPGIAFDSVGNLHTAYSGGPNPTGRLHYRTWDRATRTWGEATRWYSFIGAPEPRIGINLRTGERHLAYVGQDGANYGLYYRRFDPGLGAWVDSTRLTYNGARTGPAQPWLDLDGYAHLVFWTNGYGSEEEILYKTNRLPVGVQEPGAVINRAVPAATLVRGTLYLPEASSLKPQASSSLLDISGRRVMELQAGANDVSRLAPGVYFIRGPATGDGRPRVETRKVVLER